MINFLKKIWYTLLIVIPFLICNVRADTYSNINIYGTYGSNVSWCSGYGTPTNCNTFSVSNGFYNYSDTATSFLQRNIYFNSSGSVLIPPTGVTSVIIPFKISTSNAYEWVYDYGADTYNIDEDYFSFTLETFNNNNGSTNCILENKNGDIFTLNCPISGNIQFFRLRLYYHPHTNTNVLTSNVIVTYGYKDSWTYVFSSDTTISNIQDNTSDIKDNTSDIKDNTSDIKDNTSEISDTASDIKDSIVDDTSPDVSTSMSNTTLAGYLQDGPVDSVLNLPLSIMQSMNNKLNGTCSALSIPLPFVNKTLSIPCISTIFNNISGLNTFWNSIGTILAAIILYNYFVYLYSWVDEITSLNNTKPRLFGANSNADNWGVS